MKCVMLQYKTTGVSFSSETRLTFQRESPPSPHAFAPPRARAALTPRTHWLSKHYSTLPLSKHCSGIFTSPGASSQEKRQRSETVPALSLCSIPSQQFKLRLFHTIPSSQSCSQSTAGAASPKAHPTYRFLKRPPLTDFVLVVVKYLLMDLNDSVPHVLYLSDQLQQNGRKCNTSRHAITFVPASCARDGMDSP